MILIHFFSFKITKQKALVFANFEAIEKFVGKKILSKNFILLILRILVVLFLIMAISGARLQYTGKASDYDFILTIDSSGSMLANDYSPNRMTAAKNAALYFINSLPVGSNIGIVSFSGASFIKTRLNSDLNEAKGIIENLEIETVGGTAIGDALIVSTNLLSESKKAKVIVLMTDGQNNIGASLEEAITYINENGVLVHTIGIGTKEGGSFENYNESVISKLDEEGLMNIAKQTGGKYYLAKSEEELNNAFKEISSVRKQKVELNMVVPFMLIGIAILLFEWSLMNSRYRTIP